MPRLRFQQASQQLEVPNIAAPAQLRGGQVPNVMQFLQYDIGPAQAVSNLGKVAGKAADRLYDHYIYDLERGDRERRRGERDTIDALASSIKQFAVDQRISRMDELRDSEITGEQFMKDVNQVTDREIGVLLNGDLVQAHFEEFGYSEKEKKKFLSRTRTQLQNAARSDTTQTIVAKFTAEQQQEQSEYLNVLESAKLDFAQSAQAAGLTFRAEYDSDSDRGKLSDDIDELLTTIQTRAQNKLPERFHSQLENELRRQFITSNGSLQLWAINKQFSEEEKEKAKNINLARRTARNEFVKLARSERLGQRLAETTDPEEAKTLAQSIQAKIQATVNSAAEKFNITESTDIEQISLDLQEISTQESFALQAETIQRYIRDEDEKERKAERLRDVTNDQIRQQAAEFYTDQTASILERYNNREISLKEAQTELGLAASAAEVKFQISGDFESLSDDQNVFNTQIRNTVQGLRSGLNQRLSATEGNRQNATSEETKRETQRMDEKRKADIIDEAAIAYRRKLVEFTLDMQNDPDANYTLENIRQTQLQFLEETLDEFAPESEESVLGKRSDVKLALNKIQISREQQVAQATNSNQIRIKAGGQMEAYLGGMREKQAELEKQVESLELDPIKAGEQLQAFAMESRKNIVADLNSNNLKAVASDFDTAAEHRVTIPGMVTSFVGKMDKINIDRTRNQDISRADQIADMTGDLSTLQDMYRTFDDERDVIAGASEGDPRLSAIASIFGPSIGTIYEEGEVRRIVAEYATKIDTMDANNLLIKALDGDRDAISQGLILTQEPGADGSGFPGIIGSPRRTLRQQFKTAEDNLTTRDAQSLKNELSNHFIFASSGAAEFNPNLLEDLRDQGKFDKDPNINKSRYEGAKAQERYSILFNALTSGTVEDLPEEFEPTKSLAYKSDAAISAIQKTLEPLNFMRSELGDIPQKSVDLSSLTTQNSAFNNQINKIKQDREDNPSRIHTAQFLSSLTQEQLLPKSDAEASFQQLNPRLWSGNVFNSDRIDFVTQEQRRVQPGRVPLYFDDDQITNINEAWGRTNQDPFARANLIKSIEEQSGKHFPEAMRQLDGRSDIKMTDQVYADYSKNHVIAGIHMAKTMNNNQLFAKIGELTENRQDINDEVFSDDDVIAFSGAFSADPKTASAMSMLVRNYALAKMSSDPSAPDFGTAFEQAKKDLITDKYAMVPSNYGRSHFLVDRKNLNVLLMEQPEAIKKGLDTYIEGIEFNTASRRAVEDNQHYFVGRGDGTYFLFGNLQGSQTPLQDSTGKPIMIGQREVNKFGLEQLYQTEQEKDKQRTGLMTPKTQEDIDYMTSLEEALKLYP